MSAWFTIYKNMQENNLFSYLWLMRLYRDTYGDMSTKSKYTVPLTILSK